MTEESKADEEAHANDDEIDEREDEDEEKTSKKQDEKSEVLDEEVGYTKRVSKKVSNNDNEAEHDLGEAAEGFEINELSDDVKAMSSSIDARGVWKHGFRLC